MSEASIVGARAPHLAQAHQHGALACWSDDPALEAFMQDGDRRARALPNRGPVRFGADGRLHPDILDAYWQYGFYVFEGLVQPAELAELRADFDRALERAPVTKDSPVDAFGQPALGTGFRVPTWLFVPPLSDPVGGTAKNHGRHPVKMDEPAPPEDAPEHVLHMAFGLLQIMDSCLRLYGHPHMLAVAEAVNGPDFVPYNDAIFIKQPGLGASVAWHQDGIVHWNKPDFDQGTHGFNFMIQLYGSTAGNGVWVVPGTHKLGKVDIKAMVEANGGSDRFPQAVPLVCGPGDMFICNRQLVHGSYANVSPDLRVTINFGFHRRKSVLGAPAALTSKPGTVYDEAHIHERSRMIALGIDARAQYYPDEPRFTYQPMVGREDENRWSEAQRSTLLKDYNLRDMGI
jgi:ectoine hydroxylase-related dioxygenase (phytanoyl-CoA dioxygenase family)